MAKRSESVDIGYRPTRWSQAQVPPFLSPSSAIRRSDTDNLVRPLSLSPVPPSHMDSTVFHSSSTHSLPGNSPWAQLARTNTNAGKFMALAKSLASGESRSVMRGRVHVHCTASAYHRRLLYEHLRERFPSHSTANKVELYPECIYVRYFRPAATLTRVNSDSITAVPHTGGLWDETQDYSGHYTHGVLGDTTMGFEAMAYENMAHQGRNADGYEEDPWATLEQEQDEDESGTLLKELFFFDYGVAVMWGLSRAQQESELQGLRAFELERYSIADQQYDSMEVVVDAKTQPFFKDDAIHINSFGDTRMRLAISFALSQSTKLRVYEDMVGVTIERYQFLPESLAKTGKLDMSRESMNRIVGELYMLTSAVSLVSNVLDTPDVLWDEDDFINELHKALCRYLQITRRVGVLTRRMALLNKMVVFFKNELDQSSGFRLTWVCIIVLLIDNIFLGWSAVLEMMGWEVIGV